MSNKIKEIKEEKKLVVKQIVERIADAQSIVLAEYRGVTVDSMTKLRRQARNENVYLKVLKNTLVRKAVEGSKFEKLIEQMRGPLIYAFSEDPLAAAKVLFGYTKIDNKIVIKAGFYDGKVLNVDEVSHLAMIPSKEELMAKLLGLIQSPLSNMARLMGALAKQKQEAI